MPDRIVSCPECSVRIRIKENSEARKVRCPKCGAGVPVRADREKEPDDDERVVASVPRRVKAEMVEDDRPRPKRRKERASRAPLWIGLGAGGGALVMVVIVMAIGLRSKNNGNSLAGTTATQSSPPPVVAAAPVPRVQAPAAAVPAQVDPAAPVKPSIEVQTPPNRPGRVNKGPGGFPGRQPRIVRRPGEVNVPGGPASPGGGFNSAAVKEISDSVLPSIAFVQGKNGHGSGFVILPNVVATNAHVVRDDLLEDVSVRFISRNGAETEPLKVSLLWEDKNRDLALLRLVADTDHRHLELSTDFEPGPGKQVFVIGHPAQGGGVSRVNTVAAGSASAVVMLRSRPFYQIGVPTGPDSIAVGPGNSGGPVLDPSGRVVGVLTAGMMERGRPTSKSFCVPLPALKSAVDALGPPEGWAAKGKAAAERHVLDIAIVHVYLNIKMARVVLDLRTKIAKERNNFNGATVAARDERAITFFKEMTKHSRELSEPAFQALSDGKDLADVKTELSTMKRDLDQICLTTIKPRVKPAEYKKVCESVDSCETAFRRLRKQTGLSDETVDEMLESLTGEVLMTSVKNMQ